LREVLSGSFVQCLRNQLADATLTVWFMQQAVSEGAGLTPEVVQYAHELAEIGKSIEGYVERWGLWLAESQTAVETNTEPQTATASR
jgi:hypothetical protein